MEKLKKRLKISVCIGFKNSKEDSNTSTLSEFHTGDSGIVSDQSSLQEHPQHKSLSRKPIKSNLGISSSLAMLATSRAVLSGQCLATNQERLGFPHNLSAINENSVNSSNDVGSDELNTQSDTIDYGPIHPYMKVAHFHKEQYSDAYTAVACTSDDDNHSIFSELFIPIRRSLKKSKDDRFCPKRPKNHLEDSINAKTMDINWANIPFKFLMNVFRLLSIGDILKCTQTCRNWYFIAWQPALWGFIDFSRWSSENKFTDINFKIKKLLVLLGGNKNPYCPLVHSIKLDKCVDVNDKSIIFISTSCPNLKNLSIRKCSMVTNISVFHILSKCNEMRKLNVEGCKMISAINTLPDADAIKYNDFILSDLNLSYCQMVDDASLIILASKFKNMEKLLLRNCKRITDSGINYVVRYCQNLRELSLNHLKRISDESISKISEKLNENLRYLSLANCTLITDTSLMSLADFCCNLQYLNLHKCKLVTDSGLISLAISIQRKLVSLNISYCVQISNKSISVLSRYCTYLQQLDLNQCIQITDEAIEEVCNHVSNLRMINIDNTRATIRSCDILFQKYPQCSIHHNFITEC